MTIAGRGLKAKVKVTVMGQANAVGPTSNGGSFFLVAAAVSGWRCGYCQVVGISGFVDSKMRPLSRPLLQRMNIAQLQVVVNDLHTQIEGSCSLQSIRCV